MSAPFARSQASATWPGFAWLAAATSRTTLRGLHVGVVVCALIARIAVTVIVVRIFFRALDLAGQETATERRERHEADAEFAESRDDLGFEVPLPQRIFALQRRHRKDGVGSADVGKASLR